MIRAFPRMIQGEVLFNDSGTHDVSCLGHADTVVMVRKSNSGELRISLFHLRDNLKVHFIRLIRICRYAMKKGCLGSVYNIVNPVNIFPCRPASADDYRLSSVHYPFYQWDIRAVGRGYFVEWNPKTLQKIH